MKFISFLHSVFISYMSYIYLFIFILSSLPYLSIYLSACMFCHAHPLFKLSQSYSIVYICMYVCIYVCMYNCFHSHVYIRTYIHLLTHLTIIHSFIRLIGICEYYDVYILMYKNDMCYTSYR